MSADYSQIELRVMAHMSQATRGWWTRSGTSEDIHATTAAKVFGVNAAEVTRDMRRKAKEVNFGIMYGIGPFGLATRLEITQTEAQEIIDTVLRAVPEGQAVHQRYASAGAQTEAMSATLFGRRRYFPDINSRNQTDQRKRRAGGDQHADPGNGGRHDQARHDPDRRRSCRPRR